MNEKEVETILAADFNFGDLREKHLYKTDCCGVEAEYILVKDRCELPCSKCDKWARGDLCRVWDSLGIEILPGDIIQSIGMPDWHAEKYHVAFTGWFGHFEIRDKGNNNLGMYNIDGPYINIGHYSMHLDVIIRQEDLDHYWDTTMEEARNLTSSKMDDFRQRVFDQYNFRRRRKSFMLFR